MEYIKSIFLGIIEGITEWLPVSSTGHLILVNEFMDNAGSFLASDLYIYVIQLGAILAVVTHFFHKLNPFSPKKTDIEKKDTWNMWFKVIVACIPAAVIGLLLNDYMERFENWQVVSLTLIIYGIAFIIIEKLNKKISITDMNKMTYKTALLIGMFQVLSIIPGTSRSGSTILGGMLLGCSRELAAEFSFFLAIPVMFGVSVLKIISYDGIINWGLLITGMVVSYLVSMVAIKFLMNYVRNHTFSLFGWYRIILAAVVIGYFSLIA
ncbi:MAG: undecaprenyl-diphosphate phosphatase [Clostridiales bacterium]|nr:undecaprenyl-diphosphate phosphatase [Clostridiales bacterium]